MATKILLKRGILASIIFFALQSHAFGAVHFSLDGNQSNTNAGLITKYSAGISASVSLDLGTYFRVSYKLRQEEETSEGWQENTDSSTKASKPYLTYRSKIYSTTNALNFIVILYSGEVFVPYIFAGAVIKRYNIEEEKDGVVKEDTITIPSPNGGAALMFRLSQRFMFKVTLTVSQGLRYEPNKEEQKETTTDNALEVGIQYTLN